MARRAFDPSKCGTPRGRDQHRHRGEPICEPCRSAWNEVCRERLRRLRESGWVRPGREAPKTRFGAGKCSMCGKTLTRAALDDPLCAMCRGNRPGYNIPISRADRLAIYNRDSWTCQLCLEPVDPAIDPRTRWGATLDHEVPKSLGGLDDSSNLRLAHRHCNSVRGARVQPVSA